MLKVDISEEKNIASIKASGSLGELLSDITILLHVIYNGINKEQKQEFKYCVKKIAKEEVYTKTKEELGELAKSKEEEIKKSLKKELGDLIKEKEFKDLIKEVLNL